MDLLTSCYISKYWITKVQSHNLSPLYATLLTYGCLLQVEVVLAFVLLDLHPLRSFPLVKNMTSSMGSWTWQSSTQGGFSRLSRLISQDGRDKHPWDIAPLAQPPCRNLMQFPFHEPQLHLLDITHTPTATRAAVLLSNALAVSTLPWWVLYESLCVIKQPFRTSKDFKP